MPGTLLRGENKRIKPNKTKQASPNQTHTDPSCLTVVGVWELISQSSAPFSVFGIDWELVTGVGQMGIKI